MDVIVLLNKSDNCIGYSEMYPDPSNHLLAIIIIAIYYTIIFILGLIGNLYIIILTLKHKSLQSVQNIFILNLAISDIFLCLMSIPITPFVNIYKEWIFGSPACRISGSIQGIGIFISTYSLCAIAIDRYYRLVESPKTSLTKIQAIFATLTIWIISFIITFPYIYNMKLVTYNNICGYFCTEDWDNDKHRQIYTIILFFVQGIIPFCIITLCYQQIFAKLHKRANFKILSISQQVNLLSVLTNTVCNDVSLDKIKINKLIEKKKRIEIQKKKITIILILMVMIFACASLPLNIVSIITELDSSGLFILNNGTDITYITNICAHGIAMIICITNPILYALLNPEFRILVMKSLNCYISLFNIGGNSMYFTTEQQEYV
ncbi:Prolactin-releasing peptide receptor [Strongyloides ratti]|uniref:Prolactin-releasing peptide receptor n=1 Tax=Strongyloides ratti TaxID=34506 RepID=A0A090LFC9_STRRB|nr:Prolactin-releasing peptide receptor [Strongyloides ratti]CEF68501.1 Prolactin-releasing peptide receptor [Strongyloides ratti]